MPRPTRRVLVVLAKSAIAGLLIALFLNVLLEPLNQLLLRQTYETPVHEFCPCDGGVPFPDEDTRLTYCEFALWSRNYAILDFESTCACEVSLLSRPTCEIFPCKNEWLTSHDRRNLDLAYVAYESSAAEVERRMSAISAVLGTLFSFVGMLVGVARIRGGRGLETGSAAGQQRARRDAPRASFAIIGIFVRDIEYRDECTSSLTEEYEHWAEQTNSLIAHFVTSLDAISMIWTHSVVEAVNRWGNKRSSV